MATKLPYVAQPGSMTNILDKVREAKTPERFTQDFLQTKLGFKGGTSRQFIPLAKKIGFLKSDGTPTELYTQFRNTRSSKAAMAAGLRIGYSELFERNEYAYNLDREHLRGLVLEITGLESDSSVVDKVCLTFEKLKALADFEAAGESNVDTENNDESMAPASAVAVETKVASLPIGLTYTINLVLPKTDDPAVFNAIFKSLRDNLLRS
jgi:uncharacterized protein DUF5343